MTLDLTKPMQTNLGEPVRYLGTFDSGEIFAAVRLPVLRHEKAVIFSPEGVWADGKRHLINIEFEEGEGL